MKAKAWLLGMGAFVSSAYAQDGVKSEETPESTALEAQAQPEAEAVEDAAAAEPEAAVDLAALQAELSALRDRVDAAEAKLSAQQESLAAIPPPAPPSKFKDFKVNIYGYYRIRAQLYGAQFGPNKPVNGGLFDQQTTPGKIMAHRLRVGAEISYKDKARLFVQGQALNNVLWGDNANLADTPLFATGPSLTDRMGGETPNFQVLRAWVEANVLIGEIRAGRMASQWGLGILANAGDGFDDDFGENYYGDTYDRFLFLTNPVKIGQTIAKKKDAPEVPLFIGVGFDRLVDSPLQQYYGYKCSPGVAKGASNYDPRCDVDGNGITEQDHDYTEKRTADQRGVNWWANERDDVWEMLYILLYRGQDIPTFNVSSDLNAGAYVVQRFQKSTTSNIVIGDVYFDWNVSGFNVAFEGVGIWGKTRALSLPSSQNPDDPLFKKAAIYSYVARFGYEQKLWKLRFESGYASGDAKITDPSFTGRALHPDYNVGLLLYEEILAQATAARWVGSATGLRSQGGVYNSHYINPRFYVRPYKNTDIIAGFVMAWPDKPDGSVILCDASDAEKYGCTASATSLSKAIGWELDLAIKHRWYDHLLASVETGYAHVTDRVPLQGVGLNPKGNFFTLQARLAWEF